MASMMNRTAPSTARASAPASGRVVSAPVRARSSVVTQAARDGAPGFVAAAAAAMLLLNGPANAATTPIDPMSGGKTPNETIPAKVVGKDLPKLDQALNAQPTDAVRQAAKDVRDLISDQTNSLGRSVGENFAAPSGPQTAYNTTNAGEKAKQSVNDNAGKAKDLLNRAGNKASDAASDVKGAAGEKKKGLLNFFGGSANAKEDERKRIGENELKSNVPSAKYPNSNQTSPQDNPPTTGAKDVYGRNRAENKLVSMRIGENESKSNLPSASYPNSNQTSPQSNPPTIGNKDTLGRTRDYKVSDQVKEAGERAGNLGGIKDLGGSVKDAAKKTADKAKDLVSFNIGGTGNAAEDERKRVGENEGKSSIPSASYPNSNQTSPSANAPTTGVKDVLGRNKNESVLGQVKDAANRAGNLPGAAAGGIKDAANRTADKTKDLAGRTKEAAREATQTNTFNRKPASPSGLNPGVSEDQKVEQKARGLQANMAQLKSIVGDKLDN